MLTWRMRGGLHGEGWQPRTRGRSAPVYEVRADYLLYEGLGLLFADNLPRLLLRGHEPDAPVPAPLDQPLCIGVGPGFVAEVLQMVREPKRLW